MTTIWYSELSTPLGDVLLTGDGEALTGLYWPRHRRGPVVGDGWRRDGAPFSGVAAELDAYFARDVKEFTTPVATAGTAFQEAVWRRLRAIPYGATASYGSIARDLGRPSAVRAVAGAVARNPVSVIVPCHRVVGSTGTLTGYAGGVDVKRGLLDLEGALIPGA